MDLYNLGAVSWWESQCYYHAMAHLGREGLIVCYPSSPYVCLGLHDDLDQEINREYCDIRGIPIFRRETGGGVVYLDNQQVFFQLVLKRDNPQLPLRRHRYYEKFLHPAISVYRHFGVPAELKIPADIVAEGRKCSGNACGDVGDCVAYVGNILLGFDFSVMSNILRVPYPQFREHLRQAMQSNMTTLKDWVNYSITYDDLASRLIDGFTTQWGELNPQIPDQELIDKSSEIYQRSISNEWLEMPGRRYYDRKIKIAEGVMLMERKINLNSSAVVLVRDGKVEDINVFGKKEIENKLRGYQGINKAEYAEDFSC
ncbi:MAG: lipoate--protein ligase family protein [Syntrophomonas sp.]|nr:lipoate--protein ligase family protein [Syntrophomonas sp.]